MTKVGNFVCLFVFYGLYSPFQQQQLFGIYYVSYTLFGLSKITTTNDPDF